MSQQDPNPLSAHSSNRHSLGPLVYQSPENEQRSVRLRSLPVIILSAALLIVAAWLRPDPSGMDTHSQLGLPRCGWPGAYGIPCPTCGMTTSFALLVRGRVISAFTDQPLGALLALTTITALLLGVRALITGRSWRINIYRCKPGRIIFGGVLITLAAWGYKILTTR